jgi:hypothetical protein
LAGYISQSRGRISLPLSNTNSNMGGAGRLKIAPAENAPALYKYRGDPTKPASPELIYSTISPDS